MPAAYFAEELIEYYPDAKVILTIRDSESWVKYALQPFTRGNSANLPRSQQNSIMKANSGFMPPILSFTATLLKMPNRWNYPMFMQLNEILYDKDFDRNGVKSMHQHYDKVRSLVPKERLLEYHVSDGWEPLCKFLDKPVPTEELPFINKSTGFAQKDRQRLVSMVTGQLKKVIGIAAYITLITTVLSAVSTWLPMIPQYIKQRL